MFVAWGIAFVGLSMLIAGEFGVYAGYKQVRRAAAVAAAARRARLLQRPGRLRALLLEAGGVLAL